jgi:hypothetical protein
MDIGELAVYLIAWLVRDGTLMIPLAGEAEYWQPDPQLMVAATDQEYVPGPTSEKTMVPVVPALVWSLNVTSQPVATGRPSSVKVTE